MMRGRGQATGRTAPGTVTAAWIGRATLATVAALGCNAQPDTETTFQGPPTTSVGSGGTTSIDPGTVVGTLSDTVGDSTGDKLDVLQPIDGCQFIDFLFVVDNSASMATYQLALTEEFPSFVTAMYDALPPGIDVHVGLTTTDFDSGCDASESTQNCQTTATIDEVEAHYRRPDVEDDGGNGTQGRLFEYAGMTYFATTSDDDPAELSGWFSEAAVAAGEEGCSFEMPVAAAGFSAHGSNAMANEGFLRDQSALLIVFFLTDEPDKSVESESVYSQMILDAKAGCGGAECVFVSGLIPACVPEVNQKLWQFMNEFGEEEPLWGDITATEQYSAVFGDALAGAIAEACAAVPIP